MITDKAINLLAFSGSNFSMIQYRQYTPITVRIKLMNCIASTLPSNRNSPIPRIPRYPQVGWEATLKPFKKLPKVKAKFFAAVSYRNIISRSIPPLDISDLNDPDADCVQQNRPKPSSVLPATSYPPWMEWDPPCEPDSPTYGINTIHNKDNYNSSRGTCRLSVKPLTDCRRCEKAGLAEI